MTSTLRIGIFNMEIREAGIAKIMGAINDKELQPHVLLTQEDLRPGDSNVNKGVARMQKGLDFRGGQGVPLSGYRKIAQSKAESADWLDQTEGLLSGMAVSNKIYVREDLKVKVLASGMIDVVTLDRLITLDTGVPPRASPYAVVQYENTTFAFISVHLSGGRFDDDLVKNMLDSGRDPDDLQMALDIKALQLADITKKVHAMAKGKSTVRSVQTMRTFSDLTTVIHEDVQQKAVDLPPIDFVVLGGDCNSYGSEVTSLRNEKNPQFGRLTQLFGDYSSHATKIDQFLRYQTVIDEMSFGDWKLKRLLASNAPSARSSIYGGIVDHFFIWGNEERVSSREGVVTIVENGLQIVDGRFVRLASDHNPVRLDLSWELTPDARAEAEQNAVASQIQSVYRGRAARKLRQSRHEESSWLTSISHKLQQLDGCASGKIDRTMLGKLLKRLGQKNDDHIGMLLDASDLDMDEQVDIIHFVDSLRKAASKVRKTQ